MTRFVVGSFLLALVELMDFATYTATHRVDAGVAGVRPHRGGRFCRAPPHVATSLGSHRWVRGSRAGRIVSIVVRPLSPATGSWSMAAIRPD